MTGRGVPSLRRQQPRREPKRRFVIVCEGRNTEPEYFSALQALFANALIEFVIHPAAGTPMTIAGRTCEIAKQRKVARYRRGGSDSFEENDQIWAIFDRDDHPNFSEAVNRCEISGVRVARSNPCFELWLILHKVDFDGPDDRHAVQSRLRAHCPEYDPRQGKRVNCAALLGQINDAERRVERQLSARHAEGNAFGRPSTTVFQLTQEIRLAAEAYAPTPGSANPANRRR